MENAEINRCHLLGALESIIPLKGQGKQSEPIAANLLVSVGSGLMGGGCPKGARHWHKRTDSMSRAAKKKINSDTHNNSNVDSQMH